jgi:pyridoxamine 5'-phosphate oxidase family protein
MNVTFTAQELAYLDSQRIGRLATIDESGAPQNNPVGFFVDASTGQVLIGGTTMGTTRKFRNIEATGVAAFVVDDVASTDPWTVRGVEVRGSAEALRNVEPPMPGLSREIIRITPTWIGSWGIEPGRPRLTARSEAVRAARRLEAPKTCTGTRLDDR